MKIKIEHDYGSRWAEIDIMSTGATLRVGARKDSGGEVSLDFTEPSDMISFFQDIEDILIQAWADKFHKNRIPKPGAG